MLPVGPREGHQRRLDHSEPVGPVAVRHGREDRELRLALGDRWVCHLRHARRTQDHRPEIPESQAQIDRLRCPRGYLGIRRDDKDHRRAALLRAHDRDVHRPGVLLVRILVPLDLEDDRQHEHAPRVSQLEHQIGAKLHRDELIERRLDHHDGGVRRHVDVKEQGEEMRRELRVLAEHLDDGVMRERRHARDGGFAWRRVASEAGAEPATAVL